MGRAASPSSTQPVRLPSTDAERHALSAWPLTSPTFTVEAELGKGSFGVCFAATRCSPFEAPCRVALKAVPRQELAHHSREVETLLALRQAAQHPHLLRLHEYFLHEWPTHADDARQSIVLWQSFPLYDLDLKKWIAAHGWKAEAAPGRDRHAPFGLDGEEPRAGTEAERIASAVAVGRQLARGLVHVHGLGLIHRDLKPENVLVDGGGGAGARFVIADFGCAKPAGRPDVERHVPYVCTRPYRAPELLYASSSYSAATDVWSLGCVVGEVLCGGLRLFEAAAAEEAKELQLPAEREEIRGSATQLLVLLRACGTPDDAEITAMNPALYAQRPALQGLILRLPPRDAEPAYCWRKRLGAALGDHATSSRDARALAQLLDGILRYAPAARPTSAQASDWLEQLAPPGG